MRAIDYAVRRGAKVINASWGADNCDSTLRDMINGLEARGVLFVAAAGNGGPNGGYNLESHAEYPAAFNGPTQLTVGATTTNGITTYFSNYSDTLVHLMAPGWAIKSTYPIKRGPCTPDTSSPDQKLDPLCVCPDETDNVDGRCFMSGTSMATPFVSGAAAVLWSYRPKATVAQVRRALLDGVTKGDYIAVSRGRLNLRKAMEALANAVAP
jgi:subtilisin family serine protease